MRYYVTGDCRGVTYYAKVVEKAKFAPEISWRGLRESATSYPTEEIANNVMRDINPYTKLQLSVKCR